MKITRVTIAVAAAFAIATSAVADLSKEYASFAKGPYQYLLTKQEREQWKGITTDEQAKQFIDLFWARRDPTPATPVNEFRNLIEERVKVADANFRGNNAVGSTTDKGKVFILLGTPSKIVKSGAGQPRTTISTGPSSLDPDAESVQNLSPKELWRFDQAEVKKQSDYDLGQPTLEVGFVDQFGGNEWKIERVRRDFQPAFDRIAASYVTQPELKSVPVFAAAAPAPQAPVAPAAPAAPPVGTFKTDALRAAVDEARAAKKAPSSLFLNYGEFITAEGEYFVPVQLYVAKSAGLTADAPVTFFGSVTKAEGGEPVAIFEEPVTLTASGDAFVYARSLTIPAGQYVGTFGLAKDGTPVAVVSKPMQLQGIDKAAAASSSMIISNNVFPLTEAQQPTDPFAFGGLKVVPKGDVTFRKSDDLWYFVELRNPGVDATTSAPKVSMKVGVTGTTSDGKPVKMNAPASVVDVMPIKGVPGHYAVGQALPLASFKPGSYTISVKLTDMTLNKSYEHQESFKVAE